MSYKPDKQMTFEMVVIVTILLGCMYVVADTVKYTTSDRTLAFGCMGGVFGLFVPAPTTRLKKRNEDKESENKDEDTENK